LKGSYACDIIEFLISQVFSRYGTPLQLVSDNGPQFIGRAWELFCKRLNIKPVFTSTYHPQSNLTERYNQNALGKLRLLTLENELEWDVLLPSVLSTMRSDTSECTGMSPSQLVLGLTPRVPADFVWQPGSHDISTRDGEINIAQELHRQEMRKQSREKAILAWDRASLRSKKYFDKQKTSHF
jgi:hypothetical protein